MTEAMTSLLNPGPPPVIVQMRSKDRRPPISDSRMTVNVAGRASGSVIFQNFCHAPPPSTSRAS
jgi:hypothetical protein